MGSQARAWEPAFTSFKGNFQTGSKASVSPSKHFQEVTLEIARFGHGQEHGMVIVRLGGSGKQIDGSLGGDASQVGTPVLRLAFPLAFAARGLSSIFSKEN